MNKDKIEELVTKWQKIGEKKEQNEKEHVPESKE